MNIDVDVCTGVRELEHLEIPMSDGARLAARIWLPEDADETPIPGILEYIPYRKNDKTYERDVARAPFIAAKGYAYVRVDLRGTGESEGVMHDEYTMQELTDGCEVIAWIAAQKWCDGNVGIVGISWGGFNGLQIAALRPPALKAVVSICSTDDRYADDIHYMGGTMLVEQLSWAAVMFGINSLPPDPAHVGERWRSLWMERLEGSGLWLKEWLAHQTRDAYWRHGSICENYAGIEIPVYAVSGWADGYCRTVFRLMENLRAPCKGLVGPWAHRYPHLGEPGPAIDWLNEEVRWWDHWLKGRATGIMDEAPLRVFMQDHAAPQSHYASREGRWVSEPAWPSPNVTQRKFALGSNGRMASDSVQPAGEMKIQSPLWVGLGAGKWCSYANPGDQSVDQRQDDAGSLVFETEPLEEPIEIVGDANLTLCITVDQPAALAAARLVDVAANGTATRVSYGVLNLTHRDGHEKPEALVPGQTYTVRIPFKHVAQTFRVGHRIRLSLSTNYFPLCWPSPQAVCMTVYPEKSALMLPIRHDDGSREATFGPARSAPPPDIEYDVAPDYQWTIKEDRVSGRVVVDIVENEGAARIPGHGLRISGEGHETYEFEPDDHLSVVAQLTWKHELQRATWRVLTTSETTVTATVDEFLIEARLRAWEGDNPVHEQTWSERIPRHLV